MVKLTRAEQKFLTLLARIQPASKQEILDHAEALGMGIEDFPLRRMVLDLADRGIIDIDLEWKLRILTAEEKETHFLW